jgi:hypothetical protein
MPIQNLNIVQAEFFHVTSSSIDAAMAECAQRINEGSPIKTVVRFYDHDGAVTCLVQRLKEVNSKRDAFMASLQGAGWFERMSIRRKLRKMHVESCALKKALPPLLISQLTTEIRAKRPVAVEREDFLFTNAVPEELHELQIAAAKSKSAWVFIFTPNDLTAKARELVVCAM